ncbi:hypothetical protein N9A51_01455 [Pseudomonadales bacterium]|nr:hypothetical protein [Pseudomonadales bacterium]
MKSNDHIEYTTSDFTAIERSIDQEFKRNDMLIKFRKSQKSLRDSKKIFYLSASLTVIAVALALVFWMLTSNKALVEIINQGADAALIKDIKNEVSALRSLQEEGVLEALAKKYGADEPNEISVEFTVFHTHSLDDNASVVSGYIYSPSELETPQSQYCYHAQPQGKSGKKVLTNLATKNAVGEISWDNVDAGLALIAKQYCKFK